MLSLISITLVAAMASASPSGHESHLQHISVPNYNPKLEFLGQHVDLPKIPTKVIRITKTVAIKVPVPYPVQIPHHVPYPVHVSKPYPVPVTKIVKVPEPVPFPVQTGGHGATAGHDATSYAQSPQSYSGAGYSGDTHGYNGAEPISNYGVDKSGSNAYNEGVGGFAGNLHQGYDNTVEFNNSPVGSFSEHGYSGSEENVGSQQALNPGAYGGYDNLQGYHQQGGETVHQHQIVAPSGHGASSTGGFSQNYHQGQQTGHY